MQPKYLLVAIISTVSALPSENLHIWQPPNPTDRRSPCPMLNTLANHGFLPRNGVNVSLDDLITGLSESINLAAAATETPGEIALTTSTTGNASTFNLDDLDKHHILEHDASLSRNDFYFGDDHTFNRTIWGQTLTHFPNRTISFANAAAARSARIAAAAAVNPQFNMTATEHTNSYFESALYMGVFGNLTTGNAVTKFVEILFTQERLPYIEGWRKSAQEITFDNLLYLVGQLTAAT
ncbi:Cloroperoxidase [Hyaloscypha bicolor E]|uniref:Cloroperoxidase n=1 Tax=Hyaloscypha bicolor E TaxID=1095630 RepID=A0A2J6SRE1_9HELO|nr:Cloroperoxidase [Hyaloscypha bicolor E]PMD53342.1 Cloroperoxidase [Hyaloscypha bicolor E]